MLHRLLYGQAAGGGAAAIVAVKPAGDGIAGKPQYAAAVAMYLIDEGIVHQVKLIGEFLRATFEAQLFEQGGGQRCKAGDVGKERRATGAVG